MLIGDRIRELRGQLSRKAFSEKLGVALNTIVRYEKGEGVPDAVFISLLCKLYNITSDWLIFGDGRKPDQVQAQDQQPPAETPPPAEKIANKDNQIAQEWAMDLSVVEFKDLWDEYWGEKEARRGWLQVEVIKRFPEFLEWLESRPAPLRLPHPATLKKDEPIMHHGVPGMFDED